MKKALCFVFLLSALGGPVCGAAPESDSIGEEAAQIVRRSSLQAHPKLVAGAQLKIKMYDIEGLWNALKLKIFLVCYIAPDGQQVDNDLWIYRNGKATRFAKTFEGHGLMSAVLSNNNVYYTYSWGSGRHRSHVGRLSIEKGDLSIVESGGFADADLFVKEVQGRIQVERGTFRAFNAWTREKTLGTIKVQDSGRLSVVDGAGNDRSPNFP